MKNRFALLCLMIGMVSVYTFAEGPSIEFNAVPDGDGVEVWMDGSLFTAYRYGRGFDQKSSFYPVIAPNGVVVNREIPFDNAELKKAQDHFHHQSVFLGYGDIDGLDFWSSAHGERIVHRAFLENPLEGDKGLRVLLDWVDASGEVIVQEIRRLEFGGDADVRWMDHAIELSSLGKDRAFNDTKEGMFAIRLTDELREDKGTGRYINAFGWETEKEIWGKRAPWVALRGSVGEKPVTVAIFDHTSSASYPAYWHARAYGLFSINPFGRKDFQKGSTPLDTKLKAGDSLKFRYRIVIYSGQVDKKRIDQDYWDYIN
ncbi:MAG: PmoA family protein [Acidobacteriota bacterium]|nr:MAG: PmoA family protein [Acidobacteriota bacterium]